MILSLGSTKYVSINNNVIRICNFKITGLCISYEDVFINCGITFIKEITFFSLLMYFDISIQLRRFLVFEITNYFENFKNVLLLLLTVTL